jgi:CheY-like chemotaxis protein
MFNSAVIALSVLVADDDEGIRQLLVRWLESHGHKVTSVDSAQAAMRHLEGQSMDLVITDVVMPDGDGFELIAAIRKGQPNARILAISGGGRYLEGSDCLRVARGLGANAVLMKPFSWGQLQESMELALLVDQSTAV